MSEPTLHVARSAERALNLLDAVVSAGALSLGEAAKTSLRSCASRSARRAHAPTRHPCSTNQRTLAAPNPDEAPVIQTVFILW